MKLNARQPAIANAGHASAWYQPGDPPVAFSLTHTRGVVGCAVTRAGDIGLDLERVDRAAEALDSVAAFLAPAELAVIEACTPGQGAPRFTELCTLEESDVNGLGCGLSLPLNSFSFSFDGAQSIELIATGESAGWRFLLVAPSSATRLALAVQPRDTRRSIPVGVANPRAGGSATALRWSRGLEYWGARG